MYAGAAVEVTALATTSWMIAPFGMRRDSITGHSGAVLIAIPLVGDASVWMTCSPVVAT